MGTSAENLRYIRLRNRDCKRKSFHAAAEIRDIFGYRLFRLHTKGIFLFKPRFNIDYNGWRVEGNWTGWDYSVVDSYGDTVASVSKELFNWTDTYTIDVKDPRDALSAVMLVLAIDAEKCTQNS